MAEGEKQTGDPRDPRFRPYRVAMYSLYLVVTVGFCISLIYQVYRSTYAMTYGKKPHLAATISFKECVDGAEALFKELEQQRERLADPPHVSTADQKWLDARGDWIERFRDLEAQCALESKTRENVKDLFKKLEKVADLYTTHAVQYAGHVGPGADELASMFAEIKKSPEMGKLP